MSAYPARSITVCTARPVVEWRGCRVLTTAGLGHHRVLSEPPVIAEVVRFLSVPRD